MSNPSSPANPAESSPNPKPPAPPSPAKRLTGLRFVVGTVIFGIALFVGLSYLADDWNREATDDAFIDGHVAAIAAKVPGEVLATHVIENQDVKAGDLLAELDPRDFEVKVSQKQAALKSAQANQGAFESGFALLRAKVNTAEATKKQSEAEAEAARSTYENTEANWKRARSMWTNNASKPISEQDFDTAKANMTAAKSTWQADLEKVASDASKVIESRAQLATADKLYEQAGAQVVQSQADVKAAELEHSYVKITAPVDGRITRKMVEKGAYVQVGQNLLAIVRPEVWVTANFKETQTVRIQAGQPVSIVIEGATNHVLQGHVESLQAGSGARFSLLPPENAVGNFVKVVQRVPVKIAFDDPIKAMPGFGPGMSVTPTIQVGPRPVTDLVVGVVSALVAVLAGTLLWLLNRRRVNTPKQP